MAFLACRSLWSILYFFLWSITSVHGALEYTLRTSSTTGDDKAATKLLRKVLLTQENETFTKAGTSVTTVREDEESLTGGSTTSTDETLTKLTTDMDKGSTTETTTCQTRGACWIDTYVTVFAWANNPEVVTGGADDLKFSTLTIVTVINTGSNSTSVTTELPQDYTPPPTNEAGTRIETIRYQHGSSTITTILTYPTPFVAWPESYSWDGELSTSGQCVQTTSADLVTVPAGHALPYPLDYWYQFNGGDNPTGQDYSLIWDYSNWVFSVESELFPNNAAPTACTDHEDGPFWGGFTQTSWFTATSTRYTKDVRTTAAPDGAGFGGGGGGGTPDGSGSGSGSSGKGVGSGSGSSGSGKGGGSGSGSGGGTPGGGGFGGGSSGKGVGSGPGSGGSDDARFLTGGWNDGGVGGGSDAGGGPDSVSSMSHSSEGPARRSSGSGSSQASDSTGGGSGHVIISDAFSRPSTGKTGIKEPASIVLPGAHSIGSMPQATVTGKLTESASGLELTQTIGASPGDFSMRSPSGTRASGLGGSAASRDPGVSQTQGQAKVTPAVTASAVSRASSMYWVGYLWAVLVLL
ncbi:hypothetical protein GQ53DRAFT_746615 [Thozetella sp. PMI_491]|nr:hypothetical protein GQ53DRAFT_746615 [Thozetella sp. PMI_491]